MRILIVDDDEPFRLALRNAFVRRNYEVSLAGSPADLEGALREGAPDYAVVDLRMPGKSGLEVVRELRALPRPPVVVGKYDWLYGPCIALQAASAAA